MSLSNDLKSHPDKTLFDHLKKVGNLSKEILESKKLNLDEFIDFETLKEVSYLIGITHDFGKATGFFQKYINAEDEKREKLKNKQTYHAFISSIFTYYVVKDYLNKKGLLREDYYKYLPIISFFVVKKHHGNLVNAEDEVLSFYEKHQDILESQFKNIDLSKVKEIYNKLYTFDFNWDNLLQKFERGYDYKEYERNVGKTGYELIIKKYLALVKDFKEEEKEIVDIKGYSSLFYYFVSILLYSVLLDADKTDAASLKLIERRGIPLDIVDNYKKLKFGEPENKINQIREKIYNEVISRVDELDLDRDKILSLNVPTGTGKTLTSLSFALKLRERLEKEKCFSPRVIYSLPFLSIIDQNSDVFADLLYNPTTDILLKHHHLSDIVYTKKDEEENYEFESIETEKDISKSLLLIEGWNSEIIVTTFVQFFYSFISNRNRAIRKFHNIANSIVILDEVQAIPHKYWLLLKETMRFFAEHFNTYFVFVTATQPLIFNENKGEIKPLIKNKKDYFKKFDRVQLVPILEPLDMENFKEKLKEDLLQNPKKDFLIVMNTINSSKEIHKFIKKKSNELGGSKIYYLSTNIVPKERLKRIKEIKEKTKERKIIVSTQLIEAGVDIDVDVVYRDFAPLDSINQVAGRCNRNFGEKKGIVRIFVLKEQRNGKTYYPHSIYGSFITGETQKVFEEFEPEKYKKIEEPSFLKLNNSYFNKVNEGKSDEESKGILNNAKKLEFAKLSKFELIEKAPYKADIFVEVDKKAKVIWQKYQEIITNEKLKRFEKKNKFLEIKKEFYNYVISVSVSEKDIGLVPSELNYIEREDLKDCYDKETGFKEFKKSTLMC
ncbi:hypothetical protein BEH94_09680 [Candidatus Altiarchaeales archaeon WOR_SM1_SCG]|nr:hypothetical protein BEH94_09680 [Candidatus Altiarchaeales archaeon WOR_SM1_SCG]